jgi:putative transposase
VVSARHAHPVFGTNYRRGVLTAGHITYQRDVFTKICQDFGATPVECNGEDDHIHLLVECPPKIPITTLMNSLKAASARRLRQPYQIYTHSEHP